ncbi:hypothetical protein HMI54_015694 [Coelomomyces lativittatus]|nr:hypothetical protein HMI54_015694 [Coelomomyces lativittatus]
MLLQTTPITFSRSTDTTIQTITLSNINYLDISIKLNDPYMNTSSCSITALRGLSNDGFSVGHCNGQYCHKKIRTIFSKDVFTLNSDTDYFSVDILFTVECDHEGENKHHTEKKIVKLALPEGKT